MLHCEMVNNVLVVVINGEIINCSNFSKMCHGLERLADHLVQNFLKYYKMMEPFIRIVLVLDQKLNH